MSVKLLDVGEHLSAREDSLRFASELWWLHKLPHSSLTQYLPISCSEPLTNMTGNVLKLFHWCLTQCLFYTASWRQCCPREQFLLFNLCAVVPWAVIAHLYLWELSLQATDICRAPPQSASCVNVMGRHGKPPFPRIARAFRNLNCLVSVEFELINTSAPLNPGMHYGFWARNGSVIFTVLALSPFPEWWKIQSFASWWYSFQF